LESHVTETVVKAFMPMEALSPEAIECLENDEGVSFQLTKFRACHDIDLFLSFCSLANVYCPDIKVIELLSKEEKDAVTIAKQHWSDTGKGKLVRYPSVVIP